MFCSNCGSEIKDGEKFCSKCGQKRNDSEKANKPVAPVSAKNAGCFSCFSTFLILLAILFLIGTFGYISSSSTQKENSTELLIGAVLISVTFFVIGIWGVIGASRKNRQLKAAQLAGGDQPEKKEVGKVKVKNTPGSIITSIITFIAVIAISYFIYYNFKNIKINPENTDNTGGVKYEESSSKNYDGYYPTTMTKPNCDSPIELTAFNVADGAVLNLYGSNAKIGPAGKATMDMDGKMTVNFTFAGSSVSGTWSSSKGCSGTFQGSKQW